jgi:hypothetical protein
MPAPSACSERQMDRERIIPVIVGVLVGLIFTVLLLRIVGVPCPGESRDAGLAALGHVIVEFEFVA